MTTVVVEDTRDYRGNSRVARLGRWFANPPDNAHAVVVELLDEDGTAQRVGSWSEVRPKTAVLVEEAIQSYLAELQQGTRGNVLIIDEHGERLAARRLNCPWDDRHVSSQQPQIEGNLTSAYRLLQEHQQKVIELLNEQTRYSITAGMELAQAARNERAALLIENERLRADIEETRKENAAVVIDSAASSTQEDETTGQLLGLLKQFKEGGAGVVTPENIALLRRVIRSEIRRDQQAARDQQQATVTPPPKPSRKARVK